MKKLLLTSVFGPYGVDDEYGVKENLMELFHNQVTKEQGIFSYRFNHNSQGLHFLASNIDMPTTVLDFPSLARFKNELGKNYDYVGISFIVPNFEKAREMAAIVRKISPNSKIIIGGHGVNIPEAKDLIEHDYLCKGEGVRFLRELFGQNPDQPYKHPTMYSSFNRRVMGVPWANDSGSIVSGVGCSNKCRFCTTSHSFQKYIPFLETGRQIYDVCCAHEDELGVSDFGVLDENFLKKPERAMELLEIMEKKQRFFSFAIFSSAETLIALEDLDILIRLGINFVWIGIESQKEIFEKNRGVDTVKLVVELKKRGISVLASSIMFLEHHDHQSLWEDVEYAISHQPDYLQFSVLGPLPGTPLFDDYDRDGRILKDVAYKEWHGISKIWFKHDVFTREESHIYLNRAFHNDYRKNGASFLRAMKTKIAGYEYAVNHPNKTIRQRAEESKKLLKQFWAFLPAATVYKENQKTRELIVENSSAMGNLFGKRTLKTWLLSLVVLCFATKEFLRIKYFSDRRNPKTFKTSFPGKMVSAQKKIHAVTSLSGAKSDNFSL
ncbi:B12-binding domain-containing radical SAM protein [Thermodesulfobacteriota bacterium]